MRGCVCRTRDMGSALLLVQLLVLLVLLATAHGE